MPKYVIEREIPGAGKLSREQLQAISQKSCGVLSNLGPQIQWVESYVMDDRVYCVYIAANEELIREHARQGGFPANRISEVHAIIDPTTVSAGRMPAGLTARMAMLPYCRARRRNKNTPSTINRTFGNQTSSSGCACGFPRNVSPTITNRK
jgi:hypothetical protein